MPITNKINSTAERIFNQTKALWDSLSDENHQLDDLNADFLKKFPILDIADTTRSTIAIYNYNTFKPEYITDNVQEIMGFSKEAYLSQGSKLMFNSLHPSHADFPLTTSKALETLFQISEPQEKNNVLGTCCGLKFNHVQKGIIRIVIQQYFIKSSHHQIPLRVISTMQDVTHLMKGDCYWFRVIYGDRHQKAILYRNDDIKNEQQTDIISQREKEVLLLIAQGKEADTIAEMLAISRNTVNNHRQNLLDKICSKDTTALIELARICQLI